MAMSEAMEVDYSSHLSHEEFFAKLGALFASHQPQERDSIYLTQKRLSPHHAANTASAAGDQGGPAKALADLHVEQPVPVLVRATNGKSQHHAPASGPGSGTAAAPASKTTKSRVVKTTKTTKKKNGKQGKIKLSTIVQPHDLDAFFARYAECAKTGMSAGLKKRDRRANRRKKDSKKKDKQQQQQQQQH